MKWEKQERNKEKEGEKSSIVKPGNERLSTSAEKKNKELDITHTGISYTA